jgi:hypothetical protein
MVGSSHKVQLNNPLFPPNIVIPQGTIGPRLRRPVFIFNLGGALPRRLGLRLFLNWLSRWSREMPGFACRPCGASLPLCLSSVFLFSLHILHYEIDQLV